MKIVLLADDDARQRAESADLLRRCGCSVVAVRDADDALETFAGHHEDIGLVIVDAELPPKGAASLLHDIARIKPDVQCLLTRQAPTTKTADPRDAYVDGSPVVDARVVRMPLDVDELAAAVPWIVPADRLHLGTDALVATARRPSDVATVQLATVQLATVQLPTVPLPTVQLATTQLPMSSLATSQRDTPTLTADLVRLEHVFQWPPPAEDLAAIQVIDTGPHQPAPPLPFQPSRPSASSAPPPAVSATASATRLQRAASVPTTPGRRTLRRLVARMRSHPAARTLGATAATAFCVALLVTHPEVRSLMVSPAPEAPSAPVPASSFAADVFSMRPETLDLRAITLTSALGSGSAAASSRGGIDGDLAPAARPSPDASRVGAGTSRRRPVTVRYARAITSTRTSRGSARAIAARSLDNDERCVGRGCARDARPMRSFGHRLARVAHATPRVIAKPFKAFWRSVRRSSDDRDNSLDVGGA